jgi:hypothetical protein
MTKHIRFEGKVHAFPDDATDEEINEVLGGATQQDEGVLNKIYKEADAAIHMPLARSLKNIGQGAIDLAEFGANPAGPMMKYLAGKDIPYISEGAKYWPQLPESDIFGLGNRQPGDIVFQAATPIGPAIKGAQFAGKTLEEVARMALAEAPKVAEKAVDKFPILKSTTRTPYKKRDAVLAEKNLLAGYRPDPNDIMEAQQLLTSPGMQIPHAAVNEAVANALEGNFQPWFRLGSSVRTEGRRLSRKGGVHNELGDKLYNLAEKMHADQEAAMTERGAPEAAAYQRQGKARTAKYHKISPISKVGLGLTGAAMLPKWVVEMLKAASK